MIEVKEPDMLGVVRNQLEVLGYKGELLQGDYAFRNFIVEATASINPVQKIELASTQK